MFGICNSPLPPQKCWWKVLVMTKWHVQITNCVIIFSLYWFFFYFSPDLWSEWIRGNRKGDHERRGGVSFGRDRRLRPVAARSGCLWRSPCPGLGTPHWVQVYLCNCYINKKYMYSNKTPFFVISKGNWFCFSFKRMAEFIITYILSRTFYMKFKYWIRITAYERERERES